METDTLLNNAAHTRDHTDVRSYIGRQLISSYIEQFMFFRNNYIVLACVILLILLISLGVNHEMTYIVGCSWAIAKISLILISIVLFYWLEINNPAVRGAYKFLYVSSTFIGLSISMKYLFTEEHYFNFIPGLVIFIISLDIIRIIYYLLMYYNSNGYAIRLMPVLQDDGSVTKLQELVTTGYQSDISVMVGDVPLALENPTCVICLSDYALGEMVSILPCLHYYHKKCISDWLPRVNTCPICRAPQ